MGWCRVGGCVMVLGGWMGGGVAAQDEAGTCYGPGSVAGAVVGTLIVSACLLASGFFFYRMYWKSRKGKHSVLVTDAESPHDQYAFDNPCFREAMSVKHEAKVDKSKWPGWPPVHTFGREQKAEKLTSMDDSCLKDSRVKVVTLRSHDFTGLGFNISGNMRDGIFVKDVLHRGPAFESGKINTGDRIDSVCISFRNMVFEDALMILSYASPYDVQVQLESDSCSRPSTLMRSKRESSAVNCSDRILHPKFTRSQSVPPSNEMGNGINKRFGHQSGLVPEKNRMNHSPSKRQDFGEQPGNKASSPGNKSRGQKMSPLGGSSDSPRADSRSAAVESHQTKSSDSQNKLHKFGIKVLPISMNSKMGAQSVSVAKKVGSEAAAGEEKPKEPSRTASPVEDKPSPEEESDAGRENVKAMFAKGFLSLKERINQNTLGRKRKAEEESEAEEGAECPVPRRRSSVTCGAKESQESESSVPEEVFRAGDVARTNRRSVAEGRKGGEGLEEEGEGEGEGSRASESEESSDRESSREETKRPKRSKGKAPSPPKGSATSKEINEIKSEAEVSKEERKILEGETNTLRLKGEEEADGKRHPSYESDSDSEAVAVPAESPGTKIELSATQVTVHHSPAGEGNDDEVEPGRKAASLGDLSRLDSEQPLSIVLERAVSLDLTEGTSQSAKKRKAPLPPSEEFPPVFDERTFRKENRLEGLTTFQRRLKKSSDFGTLEDALHDDSKPPQIELDKIAPRDLSEAHNYNIQEFSSWLAECRRPKAPQPSRDDPNITATSFVNINSTDCFHDHDSPTDDNHKFQKGNVSFRINGTDFPDFDVNAPPVNFHLAPPTSRTVLVISQPTSLDPPPAPLTPPNPPTPPTPAPDPHHQPTNGPDPPQHPEPSTHPAPTKPTPTTTTLSSPLSSPLTYVTEIKVSTPEHPDPRPRPDTHPDTPPSSVSVTDRIHAFDSLHLSNPPFPKPLPEPSKIPIRTMKSETGQRVLATIQSLAKESSSSSTSSSTSASTTKPPPAEYAKRVASLFSNARRHQPNLGDDDPPQSDAPRLNVSGLYLKASPPNPSGRVPPVVPPRKTETSLVSGSRTAVGLGGPAPESRERSVVTLSSFVGRGQVSEGGAGSKVCLDVGGGSGRGSMNGREEGLVAMQGSAAKDEL